MPQFSTNCRRCDRLAHFLDEVRDRYPDYYGRPVPSFGDSQARLLIVGLAPGMHGANATGRPFTGDFAGILLYQTLHEFGFASAPESRAADDELTLFNCRVTNAVRCLPPENKPVTAEVDNCNPYLASEIAAVPRPGVVLSLGAIAHRAVLKACALKLAAFPFRHCVQHRLDDGLVMVDSYHCSRYNTQTGRLTASMFKAVFRRIRSILEQ